MLNEMMHRPVVKPELVEYMRTSQRRFPGGLGELENMANELGIPIIPHETAVFLDFIVGLTQPKNILEIGTAVGFSASLMATASPQAKVTTIDRYELMYSRAKANFEKLGLADRITQLEGDAADILPTLEQGKYDFLFMDSAKAKYIEFFPYCMDVLEVGGVLVVDDIFQGGTISYPIADFNSAFSSSYNSSSSYVNGGSNSGGFGGGFSGGSSGGSGGGSGGGGF